VTKIIHIILIYECPFYYAVYFLLNCHYKIRHNNKLLHNCHFNTSSTILVSILSLCEGADEDLLSRSSDGKRGKAIIQSVTKNFQLKNIFIVLLLSKLIWKIFGPVAKS
jgi:hypothetical protein